MAGGELQGWYQDPFGLHEMRYISAGRPTKLVRDGQVDSYDEPPSAVHELAAVAAGEPHLGAGGTAASGGYHADPPEQASAADDLPLPGTVAWSPWRWYGRAILTVAIIAAAAILTVIVLGGGSQPSWAKSLGAGITVEAPAPASPGHGSPGAAVAGLFAAIEARNWAALCEYARPASHAQCTQLPARGAAAASFLPDVTDIALGYTAIDGHTALVGTTGTICPPATTPSAACYANSDPAAILSSGKPFGTLWTTAVSASGNTYSLIPCVQEGGSWYIYFPAPS